MSADTTPKPLPENPNISHLKKQAKQLKKAYVAGTPEAVDRVNRILTDVTGAGEFSLRDAQLVVAREYGFDGWHGLITEVGERMVGQRDLHRWFGTQLNNATWDVISDGSVGLDSPVEDRERALYSAYASAYHWRVAGSEENAARGEHLISRMATVVGDPALALRHAERCLEIIEANQQRMADWDAPFGFEALARAHAALGHTGEASTALDRARELTRQVAGPGDREVLEAELARGPWFGLSM